MDFKFETYDEIRKKTEAELQMINNYYQRVDEPPNKIPYYGTNSNIPNISSTHSNETTDINKHLMKEIDEKNIQLKLKDDQILNMQTQLKETNDKFLDYLKEKDIQIQVQLKEKDDQIRNLHEIILKMQTEKPKDASQPSTMNDVKMDQIIPNPDLQPEIEETTSSVVITNIPETMTDDVGNVINDKQAMENFIKNIDQKAKIISVKRMGKKDASKNQSRPIQVSFKTKTEKKSVLQNAPTYIKSNDELKNLKVFVNNLESPDAHKIQMKLNKKKDQLYKARGGNTSIKYFIKEKQIFMHDSIQNETKIVECEENKEAAQFYKRDQKKSIEK